jgi:methionine-rich copper-binding protein CopC
MKPTLPRFRSLLLTLLALGAAGPTLAATPFHFALVKSVPADKSTVHQLSRVELWFSEAPGDGTVSIRLLDAESELVPTTDAKQDPEEPTAFAVIPSSTLPAGRYTVSWRGMGDDGHVVKGDLAFTLAGH